MSRGDWDSVNWQEFAGVIAMSAGIGVVRLLYLLRRGRRFKWFDLLLEPSLAMIGGMLVWAGAETTDLTDVWQAALTSLGAWGGPRTIHWFERKYLNGSRESDRPPGSTL